MRKLAWLGVFLLCCVAGAKGAHTIVLVGWLTGGGEIVLVQGQTFDYEASFCAERPITNAYWAVTSQLHPFFGSEPKFIADFIEPERVYTFRYQIQVPPDLPPGAFQGKVMVLGTHGNAPGVARSPNPELLKLTVSVVAAPR